MAIKQLDHLNLSVADLQASIDWYARVFEFRVVERRVIDGVNHAILRSGDAMLCIYEHPDHVFDDRYRRAAAGRHGVNHFAVRIQDRDAWLEVVERERLELGYGGAVRYPGSTSWYVQDPTGYEIEVVAWDDDQISFPAA